MHQVWGSTACHIHQGAAPPCNDRPGCHRTSHFGASCRSQMAYANILARAPQKFQSQGPLSLYSSWRMHKCCREDAVQLQAVCFLPRINLAPQKWIHHHQHLGMRRVALCTHHMNLERMNSPPYPTLHTPYIINFILKTWWNEWGATLPPDRQTSEQA